MGGTYMVHVANPIGHWTSIHCLVCAELDKA